MSGGDDASRAVALRYEPGERDAPQVVAAGRGELAAAIVRLAREHGVPVRDDPALCALLAAVDLGDCIPESLYLAVAEVLACIYRVDKKGEGNL